MDNASHAYEGLTIFYDLPEPYTMLEGGNSAFLSNGTMVRKKVKNGKEYWTNDFREEGFAAYAAEVNKQTSYDPEDDEAFDQRSLPTQALSDVDGWRTTVAKSEQDPSLSHQEVSASYGYPASSTDPFNAQGFKHQSFYDNDQMVTSHGGGESSQALDISMGGLEEVNLSGSHPQVDSAGDVLKEIQGLEIALNQVRELEHCSLESHAEFLKSDKGPKFAERGLKDISDIAEVVKRILEYPQTYGSRQTLQSYENWAAAEGKVEVQGICSHCFVKYFRYYRQRRARNVTCLCEVSRFRNPQPGVNSNKRILDAIAKAEAKAQKLG